MKFVNVSLIGIAALSLIGCQQSTKLPKYDSNTKVSQNEAIVVVGTKNVSYLDLHRYGNTTLAAQQPTQTKTQPKKQTKPQTSKQKSPDDDIPSADPNKLDYTKSSFNLRRLWDPNAPATLDGHMDNDNTQDNDVYETSAETSSNAGTTQIPTASEYRIHKPKSFFNVYNYTQSIYKITPGIYYISFAFREENSKVTFTRLPGVKDGVVEYGAFKINPGDVLYLGDIEFDWVNQDQPNMVQVINNFDSVKKDLLEEGQKDLAIKITAAQFYPHGSKIVAKENAYTITP